MKVKMKLQTVWAIVKRYGPKILLVFLGEECGRCSKSGDSYWDEY